MGAGDQQCRSGRALEQTDAELVGIAFMKRTRNLHQVCVRQPATKDERAPAAPLGYALHQQQQIVIATVVVQRLHVVVECGAGSTDDAQLLPVVIIVLVKPQPLCCQLQQWDHDLAVQILHLFERRTHVSVRLQRGHVVLVLQQPLVQIALLDRQRRAC